MNWLKQLFNQDKEPPPLPIGRTVIPLYSEQCPTCGQDVRTFVHIDEYIKPAK